MAIECSFVIFFAVHRAIIFQCSAHIVVRVNCDLLENVCIASPCRGWMFFDIITRVDLKAPRNKWENNKKSKECVNCHGLLVLWRWMVIVSIKPINYHYKNEIDLFDGKLYRPLRLLLWPPKWLLFVILIALKRIYWVCCVVVVALWNCGCEWSE